MRRRVFIPCFRPRLTTFAAILIGYSACSADPSYCETGDSHLL